MDHWQDFQLIFEAARQLRVAIKWVREYHKEVPDGRYDILLHITRGNIRNLLVDCKADIEAFAKVGGRLYVSEFNYEQVISVQILEPYRAYTYREQKGHP